jgi:hypothetical protein
LETGPHSAAFIRYMRPGELAEKLRDPLAAGDQQPPPRVLLPPARNDGPARQLDLF